jgi:hypothetical protein
LGVLGGSCLNSLSFTALPDTDMWGVKPFWRKNWGSANGVGLGQVGATTFYAEYAQYNDMYGLGAINNVQIAFPVCDTPPFCAITGSEAERWGLGVVQEIDSAAMHVWLRWQHQTLDVDIINFFGDHRSQSFEDQDLFQAGGIIFF